MHHSQLEYLIAVQKLQGGGTGVRGTTLADYMNVSAAYIVKLSVNAETTGYVCRCNSRMMRLTERGERIVTEYLTAVQYMENFFLSCGVDSATSHNDAIRSVCAITEKARNALRLAQKTKVQTD